jgi:AcrR family transcriptional regulator
MTRVGLRERKKAATRERILNTAIALISERGMDAVSVDEIAAKAKIGKGTVYNYFTAKDDMIVAFVVELERQALEGIAAEAARGTAGAILDRVSWRILSAKEGHHAFVRVFLARLFTGGEQFVASLGEFQALFDRALGDLLEAMKKRDLVRAALKPAEFALAFKTLQMGLSALWAIEGPPFEATRRMTRVHMSSFGEGLAK